MALGHPEETEWSFLYYLRDVCVHVCCALSTFLLCGIMFFLLQESSCNLMINKHNIDSVNAHQLFHRILYWRAQLGCQEVWDLPCMKHKAHTKTCPIRLPQL
jgi:hypothetical protein